MTVLCAVACDIIATPGAVFSRWGEPTVEDVDRVVFSIEAEAKRAEHPVVYVTRVPVAAPPPDSSARRRIDELMPRILRVCSTYHVIMEGEGFAAAMKRGVLTSLLQLSWRRRTFFVHGSVEELTRKTTDRERNAINRVLAAAAERGLLSD
jgi:hypothetical protein